MDKNDNIIWHQMRNYINSSESGELSRRSMLDYIKNNYSGYFSENYIDTLRNQLEKSGYLTKAVNIHGLIVSGKYFRIKQIPNNLSIGILRKEYEASFDKLYPKE